MNSEQYVLTLKDVRTWNELLSQSNVTDIHFSPKYLKIFEHKVDGTLNLFVYNEENNFVLYPFYKRSIHDFTNKKFDKPMFDIISPWYFGGPLLKNNYEYENILLRFDDCFKKFVNEQNIISEFTRLHPRFSFSKKFASQISADHVYDISYIDLSQNISDIWKNFKKSNRNAITSSKKNGVTIDFSQDLSTLKIFHNLYQKTIDRLNTNSFYHFTYDFLAKLLKDLKGNFVISTAYKDDIALSSSIFLYSKNFIHYWLSGNDYDFRKYFPNNLLLSESIFWSKENNIDEFILMGGSSQGLRNFKSSFTSTNEKFYTISKIHNKEIYELLVNGKSNETNFFPKYRSF